MVADIHKNRLYVFCRVLLLILLCSLLPSPTRAMQSPGNYLPLKTGRKWVLRSPHGSGTVVFEVTSKTAAGYEIKSTTPWGSSHWTLLQKGQMYYMTNYNGMSLPSGVLYLDFSSPKGHQWKNMIGKFKVVTRNATVKTTQKTYHSAITIHQSAGNVTATYAAGVGFVQFGSGSSAFVLDESASNLGGSTAHSSASSSPAPPTQAAPVSGNLPRLGIIPTVFANQAQTPSNMMAAYDRTLKAGINFMACYGKWRDIEPRKGHYNFSTLNFQVSLAEQHNYPISFTFQIIDTVARTFPPYLKGKPWTNSEVRNQVMALIDAMAPRFRGRVKWFMFGNEVDSYFLKHPNQVSGFASLYAAVARRLKRLDPGIQVSTTLQFSGLSHLNDLLKPLNSQMDFLALTYGPYNPDWTVKSPSVVPGDFQAMMHFAHGRKILLQEIAYPSSPVNKSSQTKQAEFYQQVFNELREYHSSIIGASFMYLADLPNHTGHALSSYYGASGSQPFRTLLQTLGMFDAKGNPKKSWKVFLQEARQH